MPADPKGNPEIRFEATIHTKRKGEAARFAADLDLDRIPDPEGGIRVLVQAADLARLLERGAEVRLTRAHPVRPLDPSLIVDDETARSRLEEQTRGIDRQGRK